MDITRDVMQMTGEGKAVAEIRTFIDDKYSQYGPSTDTEPIQEGLLNPMGPAAPDSAEHPLSGGAAEQSIGSCGSETSLCAEN